MDEGREDDLADIFNCISYQLHLIKLLYYIYNILTLKMHLRQYAAIILLIQLLILPTYSVHQIQPIKVNPNTESSPSNFIFYFSLDNTLPSDGYLLVTFSPFTGSADPLSCIMLDHNSTTTTKCVNLNTAGADDITITQSGINEINPNIYASKTVVVQFSDDLSASTEYKIQIMTDNVLPNIGSITSSLEMYTVTGTGMFIEENWNFGQVFLQPKQNKVLSVLNRNVMTNNEPGTTFTNLLFDITIGVDSPTTYSRLKFVISDDFTFTDSSIVTTEAWVGSAPAIKQSVILSPNVIITTFNEAFTNGRKFSIRIADFLNPLAISSGFVSVYHLPYNSLSPLESSEESIPVGTIAFVPTLNILTIDSTAPLSPIQFYTDTIQYIKLTILVPRIIDPDFVFQIESDTLIIHEGSVYATASTVDSTSIDYDFYSSNGVRISGFPEIPDSSEMTITMRVQIPSNPIFNIYVSIDTLAQIATPIIYNSISSSSAEIPINYVTLLTGSESQTNKLTSMQTGDSSISFTVTPSFSTNAGSKLQIFTSKNLVSSSSFNGATSCLVSGSAQDCTIVTNDTYTKIQIASNSSYNLYPQSIAVPIVLNNLEFNEVSSHTEHIYHFYFSLTVSQAVSAATKNMLAVPIVIPERDQMANFQNYFSNDLNNTGSNFPNVFRIVSDDTSQWQNVVQANERRIISLFAYQGWTTFFTTLTNGDAYPATSNIAGFTYTYRKGTTNGLNEEYPLDWDRIDIILDGSQSTTDFSVILPTMFTSSDPLLFQIMVGIYNVDTRSISYRNIQPEPVSGNPTYRSAASVLISSKPEVLTNKIELAGQAGSYMDNIQFQITPGSASFNADTYAAALMVVSDWKVFDDNSAFSAASLASANPIFANVEQTPMHLYLEEYSSYLTYIPLKTTGVFSSQFNFSMDSIKLPYNHDLPYYSIYLIDGSGTIDCYNEFINQDKNAFYDSVLKNLTFTCNDNSLGVLNTFCTVTFKPNHDIEVNSVLQLFFVGMQVSTNMCEFKQLPSTDVENTCESNTDKNELTVSLANAERLSNADLTYSLKIYGISILSDTIIHYITAELRDPTGSYSIETGTRILITKVSQEFPVFITEVQYSKNNPIVVSSFTINFQLPRQLNEDESFAIVMSKDLSNLNTIPSKLSLFLYDSSSTLIPTVWSLNLKNYQIIFEGLTDVLTSDSYTIEIHGLKTPSTIDQDLISIIYLRNFDNSYTVSNNEESTAVFPTLSDKVNSLITMEPYFNTEGLEQQLTFTIVNQYEPVTENTIWTINLPQYYSENVWNEDYLIYCTIQTSHLPCQRDSKTPYQILIKQSPRIVQIGDTYTIKVLGIPCPRATYLNGNADYVTESIFMGIATNSSSPSYLEYSELFLTDTVINPESQVGYGIITVTGISSSNMEVLQTTFFEVVLECTTAISMNQWIFLTFPQQFDNFNDLELTVQVEQGATDETYTAEVINRRIGFQMTSMSLTAATEFTIKISSLPTPTSPSTIDMNRLKVMVGNSDLSGTTASSLRLHNLVEEIQFVPSALHIVINNYQTIQVTAGTYSLPIKIQPSDFSTFVSNMKITFVSSALDFKDSPTYMYLGQKDSTFTVGAEQSIIPTIYAFDIIKTETSISAFYTSLTKYTVEVSNVPISITIPSSIDVPLGGCSMPELIELSNPPYTDLNINFQYDTELYNLHLFWVNEEISFNQLEFDNSITSRWLSFCSSNSLNLSSVTVSGYLGGNNEEAYSLSTSTISVNIISNSTTNVNPTLSLQEKNTLKTYVGFEATTNLNGQLLYELKLDSLSSPLSLTDLKANLKQSSTVLESQNDFMTQIYNKDRDHRIGMKGVLAGVHAVEFEDLLPQRTYHLCVYFENQHRVEATQVCTSFTTLNWGMVSKATLVFKENIYRNELNKALCFYVKASESEIDQIVDLQGSSCSLSSYPTNYNFHYSGSTQSSETRQTLIYFIPSKNLTTDPSQALFKSIFQTSGNITSSSLSFAQSSFSVDYISESVFMTKFNPLNAIDATSNSYKPSFSYGSTNYASSSYTIEDMNLNQAGAVYFVLVFNKKFERNKITGHSDIDIRPAVKPTAQQIVNCLDGEDQTPLDCKRVVMLKNTKRNVVFSNISSDSMYLIYYAVSNEYPLRPVITSGVSNFTIDTSSQKWLIGLWACTLLILMVV